MKHCIKCGVFIGTNKHICHTVWNKGKKGLQIAWNKGRTCSLKTKKKLSKALKGRKTWNTGLKGVQKAWNKGLHINLNPKGSFKKGQTSGSKNRNWKGGITPEREKARKRLEVKEWKKKCFVRDNYTCQKYGVRTGGLVVHHINNFSEFPELQADVNNGITLSVKAHREFHNKYGYKNNTRQQLKEFFNN